MDTVAREEPLDGASLDGASPSAYSFDDGDDLAWDAALSEFSLASELEALEPPSPRDFASVTADLKRAMHGVEKARLKALALSPVKLGALASMVGDRADKDEPQPATEAAPRAQLSATDFALRAGETPPVLAERPNYTVHVMGWLRYGNVTGTLPATVRHDDAVAVAQAISACELSGWVVPFPAATLRRSIARMYNDNRVALYDMFCTPTDLMHAKNFNVAGIKVLYSVARNLDRKRRRLCAAVVGDFDLGTNTFSQASRGLLSMHSVEDTARQVLASTGLVKRTEMHARIRRFVDEISKFKKATADDDGYGLNDPDVAAAVALAISFLRGCKSYKTLHANIRGVTRKDEAEDEAQDEASDETAGVKRARTAFTS